MKEITCYKIVTNRSGEFFSYLFIERNRDISNPSEEAKKRTFICQYKIGETTKMPMSRMPIYCFKSQIDVHKWIGSYKYMRLNGLNLLEGVGKPYRLNHDFYKYDKIAYCSSSIKSFKSLTPKSKRRLGFISYSPMPEGTVCVSSFTPTKQII